MVDMDGKYGYSDIKVIRISLISGVSVFPNPASNFVNVSIGGSSSELTIRVMNLNGQVLQEKKVNSTSATTISLPVHNYPQEIILYRLPVQMVHSKQAKYWLHDSKQLRIIV